MLQDYWEQRKELKVHRQRDESEDFATKLDLLKLKNEIIDVLRGKLRHNARQ